MGFQISVKAIPAKALNVRAVRREVQKALEETGVILQKEFGKTTSEWEGDKPRFAVTTGAISTTGGGPAFVRCYPAGDKNGVEKWVRLDEGTEPHVIKPRGRGYPLRFPWQGRGRSYSARTKQGYLASNFGTGERLGDEYKPWSVSHPGTDPRFWSRTLAEQEIRAFAQRVREAVQRGLAEK